MGQLGIGRGGAHAALIPYGAVASKVKECESAIIRLSIRSGLPLVTVRELLPRDFGTALAPAIAAHMWLSQTIDKARDYLATLWRLRDRMQVVVYAERRDATLRTIRQARALRAALEGV